MSPAFQFINKTIRTGIFFMAPILVLIILFGKVVNFLKPSAKLISAVVDKEGKAFFDLAYLISILLLIIILFIFGLLARSVIGRTFVKWIEDHILNIIPGYRLMKNASQAASGLDADQNFPVVVVPVDGWMIAFLMNTLPNDEVVVFVPGSPSPWSGNIIIFKKSEIKETTLTQKEALAFLKQTGVGLKDLKIK